MRCPVGQGKAVVVFAFIGDDHHRRVVHRSFDVLPSRAAPNTTALVVPPWMGRAFNGLLPIFPPWEIVGWNIRHLQANCRHSLYSLHPRFPSLTAVTTTRNRFTPRRTIFRFGHALPLQSRAWQRRSSWRRDLGQIHDLESRRRRRLLRVSVPTKRWNVRVHCREGCWCKAIRTVMVRMRNWR